MSRSSCPALLLVAVLALVGCGADDDSRAAAAPSPAPTSAPPPDAPGGAEPVVTPDDAQVVGLTVAGGQVTGDTGRVEVPLGTTVRLTVTSDVADEVHVHGFEATMRVSPGQASQLEFLADRPGVFEVELHHARRVLTRLQVS